MADQKSNILVDAVKAVPAVVSGAGQLFGNLFNNKSQSRENQKQRDFAWDMYDQQREDANIAWAKTNAYNDPSAQMQRLKNAGLNPNLVYGNGADAQSKGQPQAPSGSNPSTRAPQFDAGSIAQSALMTQQAIANINRTNAETERVRAETHGIVYGNKFLDDEMFQQEYQTRKDKSKFSGWQAGEEYNVSKLKRENENLLSGYGREHSPADNNYQVSKLNKNQYLEQIQTKIKLANENLKGEQFSNEMRKYEADIIKNFGVSGNDAKAILSNIFKLILMYRK